MSDSRPVINLTNSSKIDLKTPAGREEMKKRVSHILERGMLYDRLNVDLPDDMIGQWVSDDQVEIQRMKAMGFTEDTEYATKNALHTDGTGRAKVGDTIFMTAPKIVGEIIEETRKELYERTHGKKSKAEETDAVGKLASQNIGGVINESSTKILDGSQIRTIVTG